MRDRRSRQHGFSLTETLTVVAIIGVISLVTLPALVQLMPQYRIRSAASEAGSALRMIRQRAISTRTPWKVSFDPAEDRYAYYKLTSPGASRSVVTNWIPIGRDGRPTNGAVVQWITLSRVNLMTGPPNANQFKNVDCDANNTADIVFLRDGTVATDPNGACAAAGALAFTIQPSVVMAVDNRFVKYNRYYLSLSQSGVLTIRPAKE